MKFTEHNYPGTIFTFALYKKESYPVYPEPVAKQLIDIDIVASDEEVARVRVLFSTYCALCHASIGSGGGNIPDLGYSTEETFQNFQTIVHEGAYLSLGMPNFGDRLSIQKVSVIKNYILVSAKKVKEKQIRVDWR